MVLVEFTINGTLNRLSFEGAALTNFWDNKITAMDSITYKIAQPYGGFVQLGYGGMSFKPDLFDDDWPPPINGAVSVYYTDSDDPDETTKQTLFTGMAHRAKINRTSIEYRFYGPSYTATIADLTLYADTLANVMTTLCGGGILNLSIDTSAARVPSPAVLYTTEGEILAIDLASNICASFGHLFYIVGSTLYLVDMLGDNGTRTITEYDYFPSEYNDNQPISTVRADISMGCDGQKACTVPEFYSRYSSYPYGTVLTVKPYHTTQANIETALDDISTIMHLQRGTLRTPLLGDLPVPGERIIWEDSSLGQTSDMYIRTRSIQYDFINGKVALDGEGAFTLTATPEDDELGTPQFAGAILTEGGDAILTEDGDKILLDF